MAVCPPPKSQAQAVICPLGVDISVNCVVAPKHELVAEKLAAGLCGLAGAIVSRVKVQGVLPKVVMVTEYEPGWSTVTTWVVPPLTIPGPLQAYVAAPAGAVRVISLPPHTVGDDATRVKGAHCAAR